MFPRSRAWLSFYTMCAIFVRRDPVFAVDFESVNNLLLSERVTFSCNLQLSRNKCCIASCDCLLPVLPPPCATNFHVVESRRFYLLQHEICCSRSSTTSDKQSQLATQRVLFTDKGARKCCRYYVAFNLLCYTFWQLCTKNWH